MLEVDENRVTFTMTKFIYLRSCVDCEMQRSGQRARGERVLPCKACACHDCGGPRAASDKYGIRCIRCWVRNEQLHGRYPRHWTSSGWAWS